MKTRIILPDTEGISEAGAILRDGGLVAFPYMGWVQML